MFSARSARKICARSAVSFSSSRRIGYRCHAGFASALHRRSDHARNLAESSRVTRGNLPPPRQIRIQLLQLLNPQRAGDIRQTVIESRAAPSRSATAPRSAAGAPRLRFHDCGNAATSRRIGIVRRDHAAFAGRDVLHRMKAEHRHVAQCCPPFVRSYSAPSAWQASSMTTSPCFCAMSRIASNSAGCPA